uniref:Uncharacterized protein n=1 Tax=viral metagenome TaxID=1070528 RepID=A0A6C0BPA6_9ZZZZ
MQRQYAGHWEKPEWIYDQILKVEKRIDEPEIVALKERSVALFQQKMAQEFPDFFQHYTKIFFRAINKQLSKQLVLMLLKQRKAMDDGTVSWTEGNNEVIGASFNLMLRNLPDDLKQKVANTYSDLVQEEQVEMKEAIKQKLAEMGAPAPNSDQQVEELIDIIQQAPERGQKVEME